MAIIVTNLSTNTIQITTTGHGINTMADLMSTVVDAITGVNPSKTTGWSLYDQFNNGVIYTQVFRSLNADGSTYKNIILRWNLMEQMLNISTCESWNSTTHLATNEAWTFYDSAPIGFSLSNCDLLLFVHPRWCAVNAYLNGEPCLWAGVFEIEREDEFDTVAVNTPCWGWISSTLWTLGATAINSVPLTNLGAGQHTLICLPRTKDGMTGVNAAKSWAADYGVTSHPTWVNLGTSSMSYYVGNGVNKFDTTGWDSSKRLVMPISPIFNYSGTVIPHGRIYGLKLMGGTTGNHMNKIGVKIDSDGNFSKSGTTTDHYLLTTHWKSSAGNETSSIVSNTSHTKIVLGQLNKPAKYLCTTGERYWMVCGDPSTSYGSLMVYDSLGSINIFTDHNYTDIKYDGEKYVYIGSDYGIHRIDVTDSTMTMTSLAISGGVSCLAINGTHICAISKYTMSNGVAYARRIVRATFTFDTIDSIALPSPVSSSPFIYQDISVDWQGNFYTINSYTNASAISTNLFICKITSAGIVTSTPGPTTTIMNPYSVSIKVLDKDKLFITYSLVSNGTSYKALYKLSDMSLLQNVIMGLPSTSTYPNRGCNIKINGLLHSSLPYSTNYLGYSPLISDAIGLGQVISGDNSSNCYLGLLLATDGAVVYSSNANGLQITKGINSKYVQSTTTLGWALLPS